MSRIAIKIFLSFFLSLVLMAIASTTITSWYLQKQEQVIKEEIARYADAAAQALAEQGISGLIEWAKIQASDDHSWTILIFDEWGEEILGRSLPTSSAKSAPSARPIAPSMPALPLSPWFDIPQITVDLGRDTPVLINEFGERYQLIPIPRQNLNEIWSPTKDSGAIIWVALLVIALIVSMLLARSLTQPIIDIGSTLRRLARGKLESRVPIGTSKRRDELGQLGRSLDDMSHQLQQLIADRERLLRDISHELRSPLARMRLAAGLLEQSDAQAGSDRIHLARIEREIGRLDELITGILDLSRLEQLRSEISTEPHLVVGDFLPYLERMFEDASFEARQAQKQFEFNLPSTPILVTGSIEWLTAAVENVLRNAIRHTPVSGTVSVNFTQNDNEYRLQIFNTGAGIPEKHLSKIFEPFFRIESDRARSSGGTGLGLAIAARAMQAHGGHIEAFNVSPHGNRPAGVRMDLSWPRLAETKL